MWHSSWARLSREVLMFLALSCRHPTRPLSRDGGIGSPGSGWYAWASCTQESMPDKTEPAEKLPLQLDQCL